MNVIDLLKQQHEEVKDLLERIIAEDDKKESRVLLAQLSRTMRLHMQIEEKMVYPSASRAFQGDMDDEESLLEAYEEHAVARHCLEALENTQVSDKRFVARAKVLKEIFETHIEEEESAMFPELAGKLGKGGLEKLGDQTARKLPQIEAEAFAHFGPAAKKRSASARTLRGPRGVRARPVQTPLPSRPRGPRAKQNGSSKSRRVESSSRS